MKVLKNNYSQTKNSNDEIIDIKSYPRKTVCEKCESELEYEETDLRVGWLGCAYLDCPLCGYDNMLEENEHTITLTVDNIEFPTHFNHTSTDTGALNLLNNNEVKKCVRQAIEYFRKNKKEHCWDIQYGNLDVSVWRLDEDKSYEITISGDHYSSTIPFESEDY